MEGTANSKARENSTFWIPALQVLELCLVYRNRKWVRILQNRIISTKQYWLVCFAALCFWILQHSMRGNQPTFQRSCPLFTAFPDSPSVNKLPFADTLCFNANVHEVLSALCKKGFRNQAVNVWKCHTHDTAICSHNGQSFVLQKEAEDAFLHFMLYSNLNLRSELEIIDSVFPLMNIQ